jgi:hypothetical protein
MLLQFLVSNEGSFVGARAPTWALRNSSLLKFLIPVAILAIGIRIYFAKLVLPDGLCDDCYTTLRYAANLAEGNGFVFNIGESVWGTTTPLFTLLLAFTARVLGVSALETATVFYGIAASVVFWFLLLAIFERQHVPRAVSVPSLLLVMFAPAFLENSLSGMETPLVLALMAGSFLCFLEDRPIGLGTLFGLLLLARVDTLVWIGIVGGAYIVQHVKSDKRRIGEALAAFFLVALPWHVFALWKFHSLIPQTVTAKAVTNNVLHESYPTYIQELTKVYFPGGSFLSEPLAMFLLLAILLAGAWAVCKNHPKLWPLPVFLLAFAVCFVFAKVQRFHWYLPPTQWVAYFLLLMGLYHYVLKKAPWFILATLLGAHCIRGEYNFYSVHSKRNSWTDLASYVTSHTSPDSRVFLEHIGLVGYRSMRPILDVIGLVSPEILEMRKQYPNRWLPESLRKYQPEVVVLYGWQLPEHDRDSWPEHDRDWFSQKYQLATVVEIDAKTVNYVFVQKTSS